MAIPLNSRTTLEIKTTAEHALAIISGETVIPTARVKVFDLDNKLLSKRELVRLVKAQSEQTDE